MAADLRRRLRRTYKKPWWIKAIMFCGFRETAIAGYPLPGYRVDDW